MFMVLVFSGKGFSVDVFEGHPNMERYHAFSNPRAQSVKEKVRGITDWFLRRMGWRRNGA